MRARSPKMAGSGGTAIVGSLEIGRFLAAFEVMFSHLIPFLNGYAATPNAWVLSGVKPPGAIAVNYFFVLSGFVMMTAHGKDFGHLRAIPKFWWRRACRIYPLYFIAIVLALCAPPVSVPAGDMLPLISLAPIKVDDFITNLLVPAWSLRYEMAFYLAFGFCFLPYAGRLILLGWLLLVIVYQYEVGYHFQPPLCLPPHQGVVDLVCRHYVRAFAVRFSNLSYYHLYYFFAAFELYFFAGLAAGWAYGKFVFGRAAAVAWLLAGAAGIWLCLPLMQWGGGYDDANRFMPAAFGLSLGAVILGLGNLERGGALKLGRWARIMGAASYPLYLLHMPVLDLIKLHAGVFALNAAGLWAFLAISLVVIGVIVAFFTFAVDQPLQRSLRKIPPPKLGLKGR